MNAPGPLPAAAPSRSRRPLSLLVVACLAGNALWWAWWAARGCLPPSVFRHLTHLPCPTTGIARSLGALARGNLPAFWLYNPLTLPILGLLAVTLAALALRLVRRQPLSLPRTYAYVWAAVLLAAWVVKFQMPCWTW